MQWLNKLSRLRFLDRAGRKVPQGWQGINLQFEARAGNRTGQDSSGVLTMAEAGIRGDLFKGFMGFGGEILSDAERA